VLFADLVGFTAVRRPGPRAVRAPVDYFELATDVISGGGVEGFIGDAVMALWGPGRARRRRERAVRAGLDLVDAVPPGPGIQASAACSRAGGVTLGATSEGMVQATS
jgi:class 3 adenylate cyclase